MLDITILALLLSVTVVVWVGVRDKDLFTRVLAANSAGTLITVFIVAIGEVQQTEFYVDIALIYALVNFIATIGLFRYVQRQQLGKVN